MYRPLIAAALAVTTLAAPALAATDTFRMDVEFSRANLATPAGAAAEYAKIRDQVVDRCEAEHRGRGFGQDVLVHTCTERTLSTAVKRIDNPVLSKVHAEQKG
ncbi:MAG: UrcA family protein [Hyphomonas sp.]